MKREIVLNIGGKLSTGDVVGIAYNNSVSFGWYVEPGQYGSLKYISLYTAHYIHKGIENYNNGDRTNHYINKKIEKGIDFKSFNKDYILTFGSVDNRAFKVNNPEEFFKGAGDTEERYLKGKEILNSIKFPAK